MSFQEEVSGWMKECFGVKIMADKEERNYRFIEEALELVQACGMNKEYAHELIEYVYGRPIGEQDQEVGGVMVTLAALCSANGLDMEWAGERELRRVWTKVREIREKQVKKPHQSPLPEEKAND